MSQVKLNQYVLPRGETTLKPSAFACRPFLTFLRPMVPCRSPFYG
ncbi:hypothetical protein CLIM01_03514 [Colletotrichum limetticola]|uniref:Uncharacterized protein n=1 Tax=Colletotrichum limetticola TaxID=1209924 RepID=A0ABQ9Q5T1_9PEZI|nr:hypothetical protein CLIM01_03514 [Colletotrichum limetticola]